MNDSVYPLDCNVHDSRVADNQTHADQAPFTNCKEASNKPLTGQSSVPIECCYSRPAVESAAPSLHSLHPAVTQAENLTCAAHLSEESGGQIQSKSAECTHAGCAGSNGETGMVDYHGRFAWYELMTTDMAAAKAFYTNVVGLGGAGRLDARSGYPCLLPKGFGQRADGAAGGGEENGRDAAMDGVCRRRRRGRHRRPDQGVSAEPSTSRRPTPISAAFRSSPTRKAPTLALVKGLKPGQRQPAELGKPGHVGWHELLAADWEKAFAFYGELFGWQKARCRNRSDGHLSIILRRRPDDRRHVHQTSDRAGPVLALLLQCRRHRRGRGAREERRRPDLRGPA